MMKIIILHTLAKLENRIHFLNHFKKILPYAEISLYIINKKSAYRQVTQIIAKHSFDVIFNFCDGALFSNTPGIEVVKLLEEKNVAFTGADSHFFEPTRMAMKLASLSVQVKTPAFYCIEAKNFNVTAILAHLKFPMIVKPLQGYDSVGLTKQSLVKERRSLEREIEKIFFRFGAVLIEEFIPGQEYTVLVLENPEGGEPFVFSPLHCDLGNLHQFKHHHLKWVDFCKIRNGACRDLQLSQKLKEASKKVFLALQGNSFARADFRVNERGEIFFLEINPNCSIYGWSQESYGSADLILQQDDALSFFTEQLIQLALNRQQRKINSHASCDKYGLTS